MALKPCTECGHGVSDRAKQCPNCGSLVEAGATADASSVSGTSGFRTPPPLPPTPRPVAPPPLPPTGGAPGEPLVAAAPPLPQGVVQPALLRRPPKSNGSGGAVIAVVIAALVGIGALGAYLYRGQLMDLVHTRTADSAPSSGGSEPIASPLSSQPSQSAQPDGSDPQTADVSAAKAAQASADAAAAAANSASEAADSTPNADALLDAAGNTNSPSQNSDDAVDAAAPVEEATRRDDQAGAQQQVDDAVRQMLSEGDACFARQDYGCAATNASNVLRLKPGNEAAQSLKTRAEAAQNQAMDSIDIH